MPSFPKRVLDTVLAAVVAWTIALLPQGVWSALIAVNLRSTPAVPWAVVVMAALLTLYWRYLGGKFPPRRTAEARRRYLSANRVSPDVFAWALAAGFFAVIALTGLWILLAQFIRMPGNVLPAFGNVPRPIVGLLVATGALISPICEQAGIWGYGQKMLRREFTAPTAIVLSSLIFAVCPHPPFQVPLVPKIAFFFLTGLTFAVLAELTNSILPGLTVHVLALFVFFTLIWPNDPARVLVTAGGADIWFYVHLAQAGIFTALAIFAFSRLKPAGRENTEPGES